MRILADVLWFIRNENIPKDLRVQETEDRIQILVNVFQSSIQQVKFFSIHIYVRLNVD